MTEIIPLTVTGAQGALFVTGTPTLHGKPCACLGRIAAEDSTGLQALLQAAEHEALVRGFSCVIGPMDGTTWGKYRAVTESDGSPAFALEPVTPLWFGAVFSTAGWNVVGRYHSARDDAMNVTDVTRLGDRLARNGVRIRCMDAARAADDLRAIYALSVRAFSNNFLYTPVGEREFLAMYEPLLPRMDCNFVRLAFDKDGGAVGFIFALPDPGQPGTLVFKTYASEVPGIGRYLGETVMRDAKAAGFKGVIHALMHDANISAVSSEKHAQKIFRRYALFGKVLA